MIKVTDTINTIVYTGIAMYLMGLSHGFVINDWLIPVVDIMGG